MSLTEAEEKQANEMIKSYQRTIKYIRSQILELERKKIKDPAIKKFDFKIIKKEDNTK
jgi:hypothetical protein|tara:strand:- start:2038 stop:2211 length:174 start_codon:yes stop_codon:yes gene_type:complete